VWVRKINSCYEEFYKVPENALELELLTKNMINDDYSLGCLEIENKIFEKRNIERCKTFKIDLDEGGCFFELFEKLDDLRRKIIDNFGVCIKTNFVIYENELIVDVKYTEIESDEEYAKYVDHKKQDLKIDLLIKLNASKKYQDLVSKLFIKDF
jgi:hypothetical protein